MKVFGNRDAWAPCVRGEESKHATAIPHRKARGGPTCRRLRDAGKASTLLNYCGTRTDILAYTVDRKLCKHGLVMAGTHIPIHPSEKIEETPPDVIVVSPWNLSEEIKLHRRLLRNRVRGWSFRLRGQKSSLHPVVTASRQGPREVGDE